MVSERGSVNIEGWGEREGGGEISARMTARGAGAHMSVQRDDQEARDRRGRENPNGVERARGRVSL